MKSSQVGGTGKYWILAGLQQQSPLGWAARYGLAVAAVAGALLLRLTLEARFGSGLPTYITFYPAIMVVAVMAGFGPGAFATVLTAMAVAYWILPPFGQCTVAMPIDRLGLAIFTCMGLGMSVVAEFYRRNRDKAAAFDRDAAVRESRERLAVFAEATFEGIVESEAGRIVDCNEQLARMLGYSVEELKGMDISRLIAPEDRDRVMANILLGRDSVIEQTSLRKDGTPIVIETHGRPMYPGSSRRLTTIRDITLRKLAEESLKESERAKSELLEKLNQAQHLGMIGSWEWDLRTNQIWWSDETYRIFGVTPENYVPSFESNGKFIHPDDFAHYNEAFEHSLQTGEPLELDVSLIIGEGLLKRCNAKGRIIYDDSGHPHRFLGTIMDITERKLVEASLRESELRLRLAHQAAKIGTFDWNLQNDVNLWSAELEAMYGLAPGEFGKTQPAWEQLIHPEDRAGAVAAVQRTFDSGEPAEGEWRVVWPDGSVHWVFGRFQAFKDQSGKPLRLTGVNFDITERKQAEEALLASREDLNRAQAVAQIGSWRLNVQRNELLWSDENWQIFGVPRGTPLSYETFLGTIHPDDRDYVHEKWSAGLRGEPYDIEHRIVVGDQIKWVREKAELEFDAQGTLLGGFGTTQDITAKKRVEEALAAAKNAAEAANVAKSQFLSNMSHELRTPMNAILGMIDVALSKAADPTVQDCLQTAKESADLLLTLLNDLLDSAKIESGKLELESAPFSLRRMLDQITRVLAVQASEKGLCFYCRVSDETPDTVVGDRMRLQQVLLNLAGNALKFTERGEVKIALHAQVQDDKACLKFVVRDTGIGIPPSSMENLFRPFSQADASMSRRFGGTGLGLSISKSLVEMMGGCIGVDSEEGKGSTFHFSVQLPLAKEPPADLDIPAAVTTAACNPLRILLVEDNSANQKLASYILQDRGHLVEIAEDGEKAVHLAEQKRFDVILMDVQMPGMDGMDATAAIRKRENGSFRVPIIAMTAHAMSGDRDRCLAAGMDGYLSKPINVQEMLGLIENLPISSVPAAEVATAMPVTDASAPRSSAVVFNLEEAMRTCFHSEDLLREMIQCFFNDLDALLPQMRAAFEKGNLEEVGRLGHRLKGTVVYIGAEPAKQATLRVEQFCKTSDGAPSEVEEAINSLEQECLMLKAALCGHPLAADLKPCE